MEGEPKGKKEEILSEIAALEAERNRLSDYTYYLLEEEKKRNSFLNEEQIDTPELQKTRKEISEIDSKIDAKQRELQSI